MSSNPAKEPPEDRQTTLILRQQQFMVPPPTDNTTSPPTLKTSHFITPPDPTHQPDPTPYTPPPSPPPKHLSKSTLFKGIKVPNDTWKSWVDSLGPTHEPTWRKGGIFNAIRASTYVVKRNDELILNLAHYWRPESNTFVFPWGECGVTLEDVVVLGGFSVLGESVVSLGRSGSFDEVNDRLVTACVEIKRRNNYHVPFYEWIKYFKGKGGELEHVGMIVHWLSRYVFCVDQFDIDVNSFAFAIALSEGVKIALAPAVLASIYRDLTLLKRKIVDFGGGGGGGDGKSKLLLWSPMQLVQVWAWERFPMLSPKPRCLSRGEPRVARWENLHKVKIDRVSLVLESGVGTFLWRPYGMDVENWEFPKFYREEGMWVVIDEEVDEELLSFARCLRVSELVGMDCVEQYLPHRVGMQFGMDQDIPDYVPRLNDDLNLAWSSYDKPLDGFKLYLPPRLLKGDVTVQYSKLWKRVSPLHDDSPIVLDTKRKRKRGISKLQVKKPAAGGELMLCSSETHNETIVIDSSESHADVSIDKASQPVDFVNATLSLSVMNPLIQVENTRSSEYNALEVNEVNGCNMIEDGGSNHIESCSSQIDSVAAVNEAPSTKEQAQGPETEKLCSVLAEGVPIKYRGPIDSLHMEFWRHS